MRPTIDAALIGHLRQRVIEHNEAHPAAKTKLGDLRKVYERGFRRSNPGVRALQKVEEHLGQLAKGDEFEEAEHPRARSGEFQSEGSLPASLREHRELQASNAGYRAMTSEVIPDNRHEATGAIGRNVAAVAGSAAVLGALARHKSGGRLGRGVGKVTAFAGGKAGRFAGKRGAAIGEKLGRKLGEKMVDGAGAGVRSLLRVKPGSAFATSARKAGAFGLLSLAGGLAVRSQWKDSFLDPAGVGRAMDAYSYRTIQKAAASAELGQARIVLTEMLAKNGPAGGSIENLRGWLEQGGGESGDVRAMLGADGELAKGIPWGKAAIRLFSTVAGLGGGTAGSAAGYGVARATETAVPDDASFETKHPRDEHGRFSVKSNTGRAHRFAQVGGLLGGAAAALATHRALTNYNVRSNLERHNALQDRFALHVKQTENSAIGAAKAAHINGPKRIDALVAENGTDPRFKKHREILAEISNMSASDVEPMRDKVRQAYHQELADQLARVGDMQIPTRSGWKMLSQEIRGEKKIGNVTPAQAELRAMLNRLHEDPQGGERWKEMLEHMVKAKTLTAKQAASFDKLRNEGRTAAAKVKVDLAGHSKAVAAAKKTVADLKKPLDEAQAAVAEATTKHDVEAAMADDATKATLAEAVKAAKATQGEAQKAYKKAYEAHQELKENPVGVRHPKTDEPILPPSDMEIARAQSAAKSKQVAAARKVAEKEVEIENEAIKQRQIRRLHNAYQRAQVKLASDLQQTGIPKRARAAAAHLQVLTAKAKATEKDLAAAEAAHLPNRLELERLTAAIKPRKDKATGLKAVPKSAEANSLRARDAEIRANFDRTKAAVDTAEAAHVQATADRNGALSHYLGTMEALPPQPARHWIDPALRSDLDRMRREIGELAGDYVKSPSGKKLKAFYDKVSGDVVEQGKAVYGGSKTMAGRAMKDLFTRDAPVTAENPGGYRVDYAKVAQGLTTGAALYTASKADLVTRAKRVMAWWNDDHSPDNSKLHIDHKHEILDGTTGRGYWTMHMGDPDNKNDHIILAGHTFESTRGETTPIAAGTSLAAFKAQVAEREERRKQQQRQQQNGNGGGNGGGNGNHGHDMPKMAEEDKKTARAAISALFNKGAIEEIPTYANGPSIHVRKADFKPEGDLATTIDRGVGAVNKTMREQHGLEKQSPGGEAYHSALAALFSEPAKVLNLRQKYQAITGYTPDGQSVKNKPIFKSNEDFTRSGESEGYKVANALEAEIDRVLANNKPATKFQAQNLFRAIGVVAKVKGLSAGYVAPLYDKVNAAAIGGAGAASPAASPEPRPAPSTSMAAPAKPSAPPIDINKPTNPQARGTWKTNVAMRAAGDVAGGVAKSLKIDNPMLADHLPLVISGMAEQLHQHGFSETEAVGTVASVMKELGDSEKYRDEVKATLLRADSNPGDALWNRFLRGPITAKIEAKKNLGKSADHPLDDIEQLVKISLGGVFEALHPRAGAGSAKGGEFVASGTASGGGHAGVSPGARIAGEVTEAGSLTARKLMGGNGSTPGEPSANGHPKPGQAWYNPTRFGNEFGGALGFDAALAGAEFLLPETKALGAGAGLLARVASKGKGLARFGTAQVAGIAGSAALSAGGETAGSGAVSLATGRKAQEYNAPESHGLDSVLANTGGSMAGGIIGSGIGRGVGAFAGRALGGALGSVGGPVGAVLGGAALGYAGGKVSEGIYDYFAGYDRQAVSRAKSRFGGKSGVSA